MTSVAGIRVPQAEIFRHRPVACARWRRFGGTLVPSLESTAGVAAEVGSLLSLPVTEFMVLLVESIIRRGKRRGTRWRMVKCFGR